MLVILPSTLSTAVTPANGSKVAFWLTVVSWTPCKTGAVVSLILTFWTNAACEVPAWLVATRRKS